MFFIVCAQVFPLILCHIEEESSFNRTLDLGVKHFKKVVAGLKESTVVPAKDAHILFGSMGFPIDLTQLMAEELGLTVDAEGFEALMEHDRNLSGQAEAARKGSSSKDMTMVAEQTAWLNDRQIATTDSMSKYSTPSNDTAHLNINTKILALFTGRGGSTAGFVDQVTNSDGAVGIIVEATSFYYESGGQTYDTGALVMPGNVKFNVLNTQTYGGYVLHVGNLAECSVGATISVNDVARCEVCKSFVRYNRSCNFFV